MSINIPANIKSYGRRAWKPVVEDKDGSILASKFSGSPYLETGEEYPHCRNCNKPLQLFIQLNLSELPEQISGEFGEGLLQLFYCTSEEPLCEVECEAFFPFAESLLIRIIQPEGKASSFGKLPTANFFPPKLITGWKEIEDYPNVEEAESLGVKLNDDESESLYEEGFPVAGDKLAGYPAWVQGIEYPNCPSCGKPMRLLFQIDSEDNLPFMFGDVGCAHITQCETHKEQLAFGWACA